MKRAMALKFTGQVTESKKAVIAAQVTGRIAPSARARTGGGSRQAGTLWKQKMQSLGQRRSRGARRRHASGAPMQRSP